MESQPHLYLHKTEAKPWRRVTGNLPRAARSPYSATQAFLFRRAPCPRPPPHRCCLAEEAAQRLKVAGAIENSHSPTPRTTALSPSSKVHQKERETETRTQARQAPSYHSRHHYLDRLLVHRLALPFFSALPQDGGRPAARAATIRTLIGCPRKQDAPSVPPPARPRERPAASARPLTFALLLEYRFRGRAESGAREVWSGVGGGVEAGPGVGSPGLCGLSGAGCASGCGRCLLLTTLLWTFVVRFRG